MNVYDFDDTIYDGDSTLDFFKYCLKNNPIIALYIPKQIITFLFYKLGWITKLEFKQSFYGFLKFVKSPEITLNNFWQVNELKIKDWYLNQKKDDDVIISASPEFLLTPICEKLGIRYLIASKVDIHTGECLSENCYGEEKVKRFNEYFGEGSIEEFYSDSLADTPLAKIARKSFFVKGDSRIPWKMEKPSKKHSLQKIFLNKEFVLFVFVGVINTFNGVVFAYIFSLFIDGIVAFILGYIISLFISYLLNTKFVFKKNIKLTNFLKFCISYIPNFCIQFILVLVLIKYFGLNTLFVYIISAAIGVPITFLMVKFFALKNN